MPHPPAFPIPPLTRWRRHEHPGPHLCAILGGGFLERDRDGWRDVGAGSVRVSGGARHDIDTGPSGDPGFGSAREALGRLGVGH